MFGFFSRKSAPTPAAAIEKETEDVSTTSVTEAGSSANARTIAPHFQFPVKQQQQQHTPSPSIDDATAALAVEQSVSKPKAKPKPRAKPKPKPKPKEVSPAPSELAPPGPVDTPSPAPEEVIVTDPAALYALISSVPAQTLHSYTLTRLNPKSDPLSTITLTPPVLTALTAFFSTLTPPPKLHCVRCHRGYFDLENSDTACRVTHDDDSAIVERVGLGKGAAEYETLWGCCSRTVDGDGDMGPPDGWCYEGAHTTDTKRARFRADSTPQDDKLVACSRLRCNMPPLPPRSSLGRASRKRTRKTMEEDSDEDEDEDARSISSSHTRSHSRNISIVSMKGKMKETLAEDTPTEAKTRPTKRPRSRKQSTTMLPPASTNQDDEEAMDVDAPQQPSPPKSPRRKATSSKPISSSSQPTQRSPLSVSYVPGNSTAPNARSESPTRKPRNRVEVELLSRSPPKGTLSAKSSLKDLKIKSSTSSIRVKTTTKPRALAEVVDTSVDGEIAWC